MFINLTTTLTMDGVEYAPGVHDFGEKHRHRVLQIITNEPWKGFVVPEATTTPPTIVQNPVPPADQKEPTTPATPEPAISPKED